MSQIRYSGVNIAPKESGPSKSRACLLYVAPGIPRTGEIGVPGRGAFDWPNAMAAMIGAWVFARSGATKQSGRAAFLDSSLRS